MSLSLHLRKLHGVTQIISLNCLLVSNHFIALLLLMLVKNKEYSQHTFILSMPPSSLQVLRCDGLGPIFPSPTPPGSWRSSIRGTGWRSWDVGLLNRKY